MVIFVQPDLAETILALRPPSYSTLILPRPLNVFLVKKMVDDVSWTNQEKWILSILLGIIESSSGFGMRRQT